MRIPVAATALLVAADASAQKPLTADEVALRVHKVHASITTLEGDFEQINFTLAGQLTIRKGHFYFERPAKMRWDYASPAGDVVISDGIATLSYESAYTVVTMTASRNASMPVTLAFVVDSLSSDFTLKLIDLPKIGSPQDIDYVLKAAPKASHGVSFALFYVSPSFDIGRVRVVDAKDTRIRFDIHNEVINKAIPAATFQWTPPPGVKLIVN